MHSSKNLNRPQSLCTLSIIVPILNEAILLPQIFTNLNQQEGIDFELILVDGGSLDKSIESTQQLASSVPFPCRILHSPPGRAVQMNAGATVANGAYLLFLHADSLFSQTTALQFGLAGLISAEKSSEGSAVAARFCLSFAPDENAPVLWRKFHTQKARQNRRGCIHGDQGFLLNRIFFAKVGPFDETLPFLEDDRLSDKVFKHGRWILLQVKILTSARRFAAEGYWQRDVVNMLILALHQSGYGNWIKTMVMVYRENPRQNKILVTPALRTIQQQLKLLSQQERRQFWAAIARCIRDNFWQLRLFF